MATEHSAVHPPTTDHGSPAGTGPTGAHRAATDALHAPPNPRTEARRLLAESRALIEQALEVARSGSDPAGAATLVGRSSDHIGHALYFLRQMLRA